MAPKNIRPSQPNKAKLLMDQLKEAIFLPGSLQDLKSESIHWYPGETS